MKILIDNGHGVNTPGKRSPDGRFLEYRYNREIARAVVEHLQLRGYDTELVVPEKEDISLKERVNRANKLSCQISPPPYPSASAPNRAGAFCILESVFMTTVRQFTLAISFCCTFLYGFT